MYARTHRDIQCRCPDRLIRSINYVVARLLAVLRNEDIWTPDEECNQRHTQQHVSDRIYTEHTHTHRKTKNRQSFLSKHSPHRKTRHYRQSTFFCHYENMEVLNCTHVQTFSTHSVSAIMSRVEREDLEHPHCAEGLFSRASRVSVCFFAPHYWTVLTVVETKRLHTATHTYIYILYSRHRYSSLQQRLGNTPGAACHIYTSSSALSCENKDRPIFALRQEAVWHKLSPTGALL